MDTMTRKVGDRVSIDHPKYPGVWVIKKLAPVNVTLEPENGGRGLKAPRSLLIEPGTAPAAPPLPELYSPGELLRIDGGKWAGLWVVIGDRGGDKVNLTKLGGDGGRYLRATKRGLVRVDPADVLKPEALQS